MNHGQHRRQRPGGAWRGEAGAQVALLTGSSPPEACEEHFRERILVLHQKKYQ